LQEKDRQREQNAVDRGTVLAIGPTAFQEFGGDPWCEVGDMVYFSRYSGKVVSDGFEEDSPKYTLLNDEDVLAVIK
jgi:co-chaperonin GroES (HSP10)